MVRKLLVASSRESVSIQVELNGFINAFVCYFPVVDMDVTLHRVAELGGMACLHKHHVPGVGWRSLAKDSEGNVLGLVQHEPKH
jgi:predicted enzyme related to lactoylglutathione lyase